MIHRKFIIISLGGLFVVVLVVNIYFACLLTDKPQSQKYSLNTSKIVLEILNKKQKDSTAASLIKREIEVGLQNLPIKYISVNLGYKSVLLDLLLELQPVLHANSHLLNTIKQWTQSRQVIPTKSLELGSVIEMLRNSKIVKADNSNVGTQLKLKLEFDNKLQALFKPQWYSRNEKIKGLVYHGKDRHNAEVTAFHLASLLSMRRVPLAFIRKIQVAREIEPTATQDLIKTMYKTKNGTCLFGNCYYCKLSDPICAVNDVLEGSVILWLTDVKLEKFTNPWQRTYSQKKVALWEKDINFCDKVKKSKIYSLKSSNRLADLVDTAIFDFLMGNGDRHHYEVLKGNYKNPAVLLIDNGKSLGDSDVDYIDILAPLYQCCIIYRTTWDRLQLFSGGSLGSSLKKLLTHESSRARVLPIINDDHLSAINRRLLIIFTVVEYCFKKNNESSVLLQNKDL